MDPPHTSQIRRNRSFRNARDSARRLGRLNSIIARAERRRDSRAIAVQLSEGDFPQDSFDDVDGFGAIPEDPLQQSFERNEADMTQLDEEWEREDVSPSNETHLSYDSTDTDLDDEEETSSALQGIDHAEEQQVRHLEVDETLIREIIAWLDVKNKGVPVSDAKYDELIELHNQSAHRTLPTYKYTFSQLQRIVQLPRIQTETCPSYCVAYTGPLKQHQLCPLCKAPRYSAEGKSTTVGFIDPSAIFAHRWRHAGFANMLHSYINRPRDVAVRDTWDGELFDSLRHHRLKLDGRPLQGERTHFEGSRDTMLCLATDGIAVSSKQNRQCWPVMLVDYSLPPEFRWKDEYVLFLGVIPDTRSGTKQNTRSFLQAIVDTLKPLHRGIELYDGAKREIFNFKAHLSIFAGDMPAIAKVMGAKGHGSKQPCRSCLIGSIRLGTTSRYYPVFMYPRHNCHKRNVWRDVDPSELLTERREHIDWLHKASEIDSLHRTKHPNADAESMKEGINFKSPFLQLSSVRVPLSFPFDSMHAVLENVAKNLIRYICNDFVVKNTEPILSNASVKAINEEIAQNSANIPSLMTRKLFDMSNRRESLTADHVQDVIQFFGPVLLYRLVPEPIYALFIELQQIWFLLKRKAFHSGTLEALETHVYRFCRDYEAVVYRYDHDRLPAMTLPIHALAHIPQHIRVCGPPSGYWTFPVERLCSEISKKARSRKLAYKNLELECLRAELTKVARLMVNDDPLSRYKRNVDGITARQTSVLTGQTRTDVLQSIIGRLSSSAHPLSAQEMTDTLSQEVVSAKSIELRERKLTVDAASYTGTRRRRCHVRFVDEEFDADRSYEWSSIKYGRVLGIYLLKVRNAEAAFLRLLVGYPEQGRRCPKYLPAFSGYEESHYIPISHVVDLFGYIQRSNRLFVMEEPI